MSRTFTQAVIFTIGVTLTSVTMVFDQATIGMMRGSLQLSRNLAFALGKLAILPAVAVIMHDQLGIGITLSWVAGTAASMTLVLIRLHLSGSHVFPRPDWAILRALGKTALAHNWLNLAIAVPRSFVPVLVTIVVSPSANAAFYAAWTLTGFLYIVPMHLATVLFAIAAADPKTIARKLRLSLRLSFYWAVWNCRAVPWCPYSIECVRSWVRACSYHSNVAYADRIFAHNPQNTLHRRVQSYRESIARSISIDNSWCCGSFWCNCWWGSTRTEGTDRRTGYCIHP